MDLRVMKKFSKNCRNSKYYAGFKRTECCPATPYTPDKKTGRRTWNPFIFPG